MVVTALQQETQTLIEILSTLPNTFKPHLKAYTDGACSGNPGPGGWGAVLHYQGLEQDLSGGDPSTTNNRMEMSAAIGVLTSLPFPAQVDLYTDSQYLRDGITQWMANWKKNGWKTADRKPVKNQDLWLLLDDLISKHQVAWHWIRGHSGHPENERADALARNAIIAQRMNLMGK
ncbi:MAG: ribonuclease HI [Alphaproteobacteria bacterium]|nr:ribonuclease HI [Alphaproteobacteria bacterium]